MPYLQPAPIEGMHRYVFLLFKQVFRILQSPCLIRNEGWIMDFVLFILFHVWKNYVLLSDQAMSVYVWQGTTRAQYLV
jgi:hypothetical protein